MTFKLLIDDCLSPRLVDGAQAAGFMESTCVRNRGLAGARDWQLMPLVIAEDIALVTNNSMDFCGVGGHAPGGLHAGADIHAGLICLNCAVPGGMDLDRQRDLFRIALKQLEGCDDLINQAPEVFEEVEGSSSRRLAGSR